MLDKAARSPALFVFRIGASRADEATKDISPDGLSLLLALREHECKLSLCGPSRVRDREDGAWPGMLHIRETTGSEG